MGKNACLFTNQHRVLTTKAIFQQLETIQKERKIERFGKVLVIPTQ